MTAVVLDAARERALDLRLGAFHEAVLELGSAPLPACYANAFGVVTARKIIDRFIAEDGKGRYPDME